MVLLYLLRALQARLGFRLAAVHVNHQISAHADEWQGFCERLCRDCGVALTCHRVSVPRGCRGLEAEARAQRYAVLTGLNTDWIALAHHRDDQAETVLHNLLRGAGVRGAAAMPTTRSLGAGAATLIRPLLAVARTEIEAAARAAALTWIEDESNLDTSYARNFLRREILPRLSERFPGCESALARAASRCAEAEEVLEELAAADLALAARGACVDVGALRRLSPARANNLLRFWLRRRGVPMPEAAALHEILRQGSGAASDRQMQVRIGKQSVRRFAGHLHVIADDAAPVPAEVAWHGESALPWGGGRVWFTQVIGEGVSAAALARHPLCLRKREGGERLRLAPVAPRRTLKKLFQEHRIPPWQRANLPLLWCGDDVAWVAGIGAASEYRCGDNEPGWQIDWAAP